jgi:Holliday junction DNA helicase RuvA
MIYSLRGTLTCFYEDFLVLEVQGVGYQVFVPAFYSSKLQQDSEVYLLIYHHIREELQLLFGFLGQDERDLFLKLIQVSGVGPKVAIKILSAFPPQDFIQFIMQGNIHALMQVPGIGKKVAERMVIELKDRLDGISSHPVGMTSVHISGQWQKDLMLAMKTLGYTQEEIKNSFQNASHQLKESMSLEEGMKILLKHL